VLDSGAYDVSAYEYIGPVVSVLPAERRSEAEARLANFLADQKRVGSNGTVFIEDSNGIPQAVSCAASQLEADLVVIGRAASHGVLGRLRTNAYSIIRQSPCPVVSV
jgi:nucleotide-binding universal stress UspA family protein